MLLRYAHNILQWYCGACIVGVILSTDGGFMRTICHILQGCFTGTGSAGWPLTPLGMSGPYHVTTQSYYHPSGLSQRHLENHEITVVVLKQP